MEEKQKEMDWKEALNVMREQARGGQTQGLERRKVYLLRPGM